MKKHAFLIIAHNEYDILKRLVALLDDERADIYIHIDKKSEMPEKIETTKSNLIFVPRLKVYWGDSSQIKCELGLLKAATEKAQYDYYHLLSGSELLLVSNEKLYKFFDDNYGYNFIGFDPRFDSEGSEIDKVKYYHLFNRAKHSLPKRITLSVQKKLKVNRLKNVDFKIYKGSNWISITDEFARYVLSKRNFIRKHFGFTCCGDEIFIHTLLMNSGFKDKIKNPMRYIDWSIAGSASPKTLTMDDLNKIYSSGNLFARKFSSNVDTGVIDYIYDRVLKSKNKLQ